MFTLSPACTPRPVQSALLTYPLVFLISAFLYLTAPISTEPDPFYYVPYPPVCACRRSARDVYIHADHPRLPISPIAANAIVFFYSRNNPVDSIGGEIAMSQYFVGAVDYYRPLLLLYIVLYFISSFVTHF